MTDQQTPGPWTYEVHELSTGYSAIVYDEHGYAVADHLPEDVACLIAASPELLEAARELTAWYGPFNPTKHPPEINGAWLRMQAAIAKARGQ